MTTSSAEISTLPTGEPVPSSTPPPPAKPARPVALGSALAAAPANVDAFLAHLHRCMQTPAGIDCVLQFVCYTARLSAAGLTILGTNALRRSAKEVALLVLSLPPSSAVVVTSPSASASTLSLVAAARLRALAGVMAEARVAHRLWGLLGMYFWARRLIASSLRRARASEKSDADSSAAPTAAAAATALQWAQLLSCAGFQVLENVAFLSSKGVLGYSPVEQARIARWSSRCWGAFIGMELGRLAIEAARGGAAVRDAEWKKTMTRYVAWSPVIVHWGTEGGLLSELGVGLLGCIPSVIQMRDLWKTTAVSA